MKRSWFASGVVAAVIVGTVGIGAVGVSSPAVAAPPSSPWSGDAGGNVADVTTTAATLNVAGLGVAVSNATTDSTASPQVRSTSSNIDAAVAGLPIAVSTNSVSAPPDAGPTTGGIAADVTGLIDVGAITTTNEAHWSLPAVCNTTGVISAATTQTAGLSVLPALGGGMLSLGVSQSNGSTSLTQVSGQNSGLNHGVKSVATGSITGLSMLGGAVNVNVQGTTTLTATASGTVAGTVAYQPAVVTVTANGTTTTLNVGDPATVINIALVGSVTLQMKAPVSTTTATSAQTSVSLLSVSVALLGGVASTDVNVLPLTANATAPAGGIDCPPPAPVITVPTAGQAFNTPTPTITGTAEHGATVTVNVDGLAPVTTTADATTGAWSVPSPSLADGPHTVNATQAVNGVSGPASADVAFSVDTVAPSAPTVITPANGTVTNNNKPPITGTAEANSTVTVNIDGTAVGTTPADGTGNWTFTPTTALSDASHTVNATAKDAAGNISAVSNTNTFTVDTVAPVAPVVSTPANGSVTNNPKPPITGTAEANSTVTVSIDGTVVGTTPADGSGNWTFTPTTALSDASHTVNATAKDAAGNISPVSNTNTFTVDTTPPAAPVISSPVDGSSTNAVQPPITGAAEANSVVTVTIDGTPRGTTAADGSGNWTFTPPTPLADGVHSVVATAKDAAGNISPDSNQVQFTVDTLPPAPPVVLTPASGSVTNNPKPLVTGTAEANSTVTVSIDGAVVGTTPADGSGNWTFTPTTALTDASHTVNATAKDAAGNVSPVSNTNTFTVDTTPPLAPVVSTPATGSVTKNPKPPITGTAEANSTVTVSIDGAVVGTTPADGSGNWTFTPTTALTDASHTVNATAKDAAGNISPVSNTNTFTVDTTPPAAPVITAPVNGSSTADTTPAITGTAEANSTVTVTTNGSVAGTTTADGSGNWSFTPSTPLTDGPYTVTATATDAAGNTSPASAPVTFTVDTAAPAAPVITAPASGSSTSDTTPDIKGTAEAGSTVTVIIDGTAVGTTKADGSGNWTYTPTTPLAEGAHTVTATATDAAGNVSPEASPVSFTVDTLAPAAPVITSPADGSTTTNPTPPITGTAEPNSTVTVIVNGTPVGTTKADGQGNWTFTPTTPLPNGTDTITATATDAAGNISPASAPVTVTISAPTPDPSPTIPPTTPSSLPVTGGGDMLGGWVIGALLIALGIAAVRFGRRRVG
ncbi:Ig-like domain-containing protein [Microbacterium sp. ASV49]|uniref:Ig-like domain-containing protein n=1 Tax=Microbacterium candidum TaxID=3041922 RepID=A0ABT7MYB1_9MICO|nr:Ig-like domain-containing protein [Microbacterium sp. ASV49]MDL9979421.1 Ig-like domain-containing protein [Microbacterium sp. ASV49]